MTEQPDTVVPLFERIRQAFPGVRLESAVVNTDGLVNVAVICDGQVYRFARNDYAREDLKREAAVLQLVQQYVTMPVPVFALVDDDFVTYRFIEGSPLFRNDILRLPESGQDRIAAQLAAFLRDLHDIPLAAVEAAGIGRSGGRQTQAEWLTLYDTVRKELYPLMYRSTRAWVDEHFAPLLADPAWLAFEPALIHDDLAHPVRQGQRAHHRRDRLRHCWPQRSGARLCHSHQCVRRNTGAAHGAPR